MNELRRSGCPASDPGRSTLEQYFERAFQAGRRLATYGSLRPGEVNHWLLESVGGAWTSDLAVYGSPVDSVLGVALDFPAIRWTQTGEPIGVHLLTSGELPRVWSRLDEFEGSNYRRVLVPLMSATTFVTVANLYEGVVPSL